MDGLDCGACTRSIIVPDWISQAITRNNLNTIDILNYSKLRNILSIEDMAQLVAVNTGMFDQYVEMTTSGLIGIWNDTNKLTSEQQIELDTVISKLAYSELTQEAVVARLTNDGANDSSNASPLFSIRSLQDKLIVINIARGFLNAIKDREFAIQYLSEYLKSLYSHESTYKVSAASRAYRLYLELLSKKSRGR